MKTLKEYMNATTNDLKKKFDNYLNISNNISLSTKDEKEMKAQMLAAKHTIENLSKGHIIPVEMKDITQAFEKASYDLKKLPLNIATGLENTYNAFKEGLSNSTVTKDSIASVYCDIYENFSNNNVKRYFERVKTSKLFNNKMSKEMFKGMEAFEQSMVDNNYSMSMEGPLSSYFVGIGTNIMAKTGLVGLTASGISAINILNIMLLVLSCLAIVLTIIHAMYVKEVSDLNKNLTAGQIQNKEEIKRIKNKDAQKAIENLDINTPTFTKNFLIKPAYFGNLALKKMSNASFSVFDKGLTVLEKKMKSGESLDLDNLDKSMSTEDAAALTALVTAFKAGLLTLSPIIGTGMVIAMIIMIVPLTRMMVHFIHRMKMKLSVFFEEQATWVKNNYEDLEEKLNDESLPETERRRLEKIIAKQKVWYKNMSAFGQTLYKKQIEAGTEARDAINKEERIDFDTMVDKIDENNDEIDKNIIMQEDPEDPDPNYRPTPEPMPRPVVIF